ncbi:hypothetical protein D3C77_684600 [compost metagenome]
MNMFPCMMQYIIFAYDQIRSFLKEDLPANFPWIGGMFRQLECFCSERDVPIQLSRSRLQAKRKQMICIGGG